MQHLCLARTNLFDGVVAELGETALASLGVGLLGGPLLGGGIKELLTPQPAPCT